MQNYIELLKNVLDNGVDKPDRTGIGCRSIFGSQLHFDLSKGFPLLTTRKIALRIAFEETMFFLRGETNTKILEDKKINIWKGNTSREFLDNKGLHYLPEGSIGTGYSHQWRNFNGTLGMQDGVDQIKNLLEGIKSNPYDRRHVVTAWNPSQLNGTPLPPCHLMHMYSVVDGTLHNNFIMRSVDVPYGLPYDIADYALLNYIFSKHLNLIPGTLVFSGWDTHIYHNQFEMVKEQVTRKHSVLPQLNIKKDLNTFNDILSLQWEDIELLNYNPMPDIKNKPPMAI